MKKNPYHQGLTDKERKAERNVIEAAEIWLHEVKGYSDLNLLALDNAIQELQKVRAERKQKKGGVK